MDEKPRFSKSILAAAAAVLLALGLLIAFFVDRQSNQNQNTIVLPDPPAAPAVPEQPEKPPEQSFLQVTAENIGAILEGLTPPEAYHQIYTIAVGANEAQTTRTVELWVNGGLLRGQVSDGVRTRTVLTDGSRVYMWYDGDAAALEADLPEGVTAEDLLGLPDADLLQSLPQEEIVDADYLVLEDQERVSCVYVCRQESAQTVGRYWVDLDTGLLYKADMLELSQQVYALRQESFESLAAGDQAFQDRFVLPDGVQPFATESKTPQS